MARRIGLEILVSDSCVRIHMGGGGGRMFF
jgi:hypothetical protein